MDTSDPPFLVVLRANAPPRTTPRLTQTPPCVVTIAMTDTNGDEVNPGLNAESLLGLDEMSIMEDEVDMWLEMELIRHALEQRDGPRAQMQAQADSYDL
jgi:hypothetical protein